MNDNYNSNMDVSNCVDEDVYGRIIDPIYHSECVLGRQNKPDSDGIFSTMCRNSSDVFMLNHNDITDEMSVDNDCQIVPYEDRATSIEVVDLSTSDDACSDVDIVGEVSVTNQILQQDYISIKSCKVIKTSRVFHSNEANFFTPSKKFAKGKNMRTRNNSVNLAIKRLKNPVKRRDHKIQGRFFRRHNSTRSTVSDSSDCVIEEVRSAPSTRTGLHEQQTQCPVYHAFTQRVPKHISCFFRPSFAKIYAERRKRPVVIDGPNIGFADNSSLFKPKLIQITLDLFRQLGHRCLVFLPGFYTQHDKQFFTAIRNSGELVETPSRIIENKRVTCYEDRFMIIHATNSDSVIVSRDRFRDVSVEKDEWKITIDHRLLIPVFIEDSILLPPDPLGKEGPSLEEFLTFPD